MKQSHAFQDDWSFLQNKKQLLRHSHEPAIYVQNWQGFPLSWLAVAVGWLCITFSTLVAESSGGFQFSTSQKDALKCFPRKESIVHWKVYIWRCKPVQGREVPRSATVISCIKSYDFVTSLINTDIYAFLWQLLLEHFALYHVRLIGGL